MNSPINDRRPVPARPAGALIGRIGTSPSDVFFIGGDRGSFRVRTSGRLYLGVNDHYLRRQLRILRGPGQPLTADDDDPPEDEEAVVLPVTGELDLHAFAPRDVVSVVAEYLDECGRRGIRTVRLAHGRGKGVQRAEIRRLLAGREDVAALRGRSAGVGRMGSDGRAPEVRDIFLAPPMTAPVAGQRRRASISSTSAWMRSILTSR